MFVWGRGRSLPFLLFLLLLYRWKRDCHNHPAGRDGQDGDDDDDDHDDSCLLAFEYVDPSHHAKYYADLLRQGKSRGDIL